MNLLFAAFGQPSFSSGPPAIFMFFFVVIFVVILGTFVVRAGRGLAEWSENNQQPELTVRARVVTKRADTSVSSTHHAGTSHWDSTSSTRYFATFEFESGDRKEFSLSAREYGMVAEQDVGDLTFQGTRYMGFGRAFVDEAKPAAAVPEDNAPPVKTSSSPADEPAYCPHCGVPVTAEFRFCPKCGQPLAKNPTPA